jgi:putative ABC transport system substrate-binding protein
VAQLQRIAPGMQVQLFLAEVSDLSEVAPQFRALTRDHNVQAIWIIQNDDLLNSSNGRSFLIKSTIKAGVPLFAPNEGWVTEGAFIAMKKDADGVALVVNKAAADALSLAVPEQYMDRTQFMAAN